MLLLAKEMIEQASSQGLEPTFDVEQHIVDTTYNAVHHSFPQLGFSISIHEEQLHVNWETKTGFHEKVLTEFSKEGFYDLTRAIKDSQ